KLLDGCMVFREALFESMGWGEVVSYNRTALPHCFSPDVCILQARHGLSVSDLTLVHQLVVPGVEGELAAFFAVKVDTPYLAASYGHGLSQGVVQQFLN